MAKKKTGKKAKPKSTGEIRVITTDLPGYRFPYAPAVSDVAFGYALVQARSEGGEGWQPRWCLVDTDGTPLAIFEADDFENLSPDAVAQAAGDFLMALHELGEEDTGVKMLARNKHRSEESSSFELH